MSTQSLQSIKTPKLCQISHTLNLLLISCTSSNLTHNFPAFMEPIEDPILPPKLIPLEAATLSISLLTKSVCPSFSHWLICWTYSEFPLWRLCQSSPRDRFPLRMSMALQIRSDLAGWIRSAQSESSILNKMIGIKFTFPAQVGPHMTSGGKGFSLLLLRRDSRMPYGSFEVFLVPIITPCGICMMFLICKLVNGKVCWLLKSHAFLVPKFVNFCIFKV